MLIFRLLSHRAAKTKKERELERENAFALRSPARALKIKTILLINYNFDHVLPSGNKTPLPVHLPSKFFGPPFLEKSIKISSFPLNSPSSSHFFVFSPAEHPGVPSSPKTLADVFDRTSIPLKHPGWFGSEYLPLKTEEEDSVVIVAPDDKTSAFIANAAVFVVVVISKRTVAAAFAATFDDDDEKLLEQNTGPFFFFDFFECRAEVLLAGEAGKKRWTTTDDDEKFVAPIIFLRCCLRAKVFSSLSRLAKKKNKKNSGEDTYLGFQQQNRPARGSQRDRLIDTKKKKFKPRVPFSNNTRYASFSISRTAKTTRAV